MSARERFMEIKESLADPQKRKEWEEENAAWEIVRRDFSWEWFRDNWACSFASFEENTIIPCMRFTDAEVESHDCPYNVCPMDTMQIVSVAVTEITGGLQWPLDVYGFVATRDMPERRRIMIYDRERDDCQRIDEDSYLTLTGPTRGVITSTDASYLEVHLKVKGAKSEDKDISKFAKVHRIGRSSPIEHTSKLSTVELQHYTVFCSVEAAISARVVDGTWPFGFRGEFTASTACQSGVEITLLDFNDVGLSVGADGFIKLSRSVVCVEDRGSLAVSVYEYGAEEYTWRASASFIAGRAKRSINNMKMGSCWIEVCVAWSLFGY